MTDQFQPLESTSQPERRKAPLPPEVLNRYAKKSKSVGVIATHKICKTCNATKPIKSFAVVEGTRRRSSCNKCTRLKQKARKHNIEPEQYLEYCNGPCQICGQPDGKVYSHSRSNQLMRVCPSHRILFRGYNKFDQLLLIDQIAQQFPFWLDFLKQHDLWLFDIDE